MTNFPLRHFPLLLLAALAILGLAFGHLAGSITGYRLSKNALPAKQIEKPEKPSSAAKLSDYEIIVGRSLFAPQLAGKASLSGSDQAGLTAASSAPVDLVLLGTVAGGARPLALTRVSGESKIVRIGDTLANGAKIVAIGRQSLTVRRSDGSEQTILPPEIPNDAATAPAGSSPAIRSTSDNRFSVPRNEAEKARGNLGELMKQARMEPFIVDGQTRGFEVKMIKPDTIFTKLGLLRGDVIRQVNGVPLDSPEKALQIFQQLREARHIVIALERSGAPMSLEYNLD